MAQPIVFASAEAADEIDAIDPEVVTSILSHNRYGAGACGWGG